MNSNYLRELNEKQLEAVKTTKDKVLVMAGAGSGKTRVLTSRIKYLIDCGVDYGEICAFTFTNKAAHEMKTRLKQMLRKDGETLHQVKTPIISTFHSYCYQIIRFPELFSKLGFTNYPNIITEEDKASIIKDILKKYAKDYSNIPFVSAIAKLKNKSKVDDLNSSDLLILNAVYKEYQNKLLSSNLIDYDDMVPLFLKLCEEDYILDSNQFKYILVDECQDTNQIQYELIKTLSRKYQNVFMVGDEDQLIYSFRSSDISIIKDFKDNADEVIILNQNYRCNQDILTHANTLIDFNSNRLKKELFSNIITNHKVVFKEFSSVTEQASAVVSEINKLLRLGINPNDIAILYRNNNQSFLLEKELTNASIPYKIYGGKQFFTYSEIKALIYTYRLILDPNCEVALHFIYNYIYSTITEADYNEFYKDYLQVGGNVILFASGYTYDNRFQKVGFELLKLQDLYKKLKPLEFFDEILKTLKFNKYLKESNKQKSQYKRIMAFREMLEDSNLDDIDDFINQIILENISDKKVLDGISLLTIHKAKGLEFEVVFLIGFNDGIIPGLNNKGDALEEERRLAYVAMTRAKERLYIYCAIIHFINGNMYKFKPSQFLSEAGIESDNPLNFFGNYWYNH